MFCTIRTTHKLLMCKKCVCQVINYHFCATSLHAGLPPMSKVCKDRSRSQMTTKFGFVGSSANKGCDAGKVWCTHLATQFRKNKSSTSATQAYAALAAAASAAGAHSVSKTSRFGMAYKNTARDLKKVVLQNIKVTQPYMVTSPVRSNKTGLVKYEDHQVLLPHEVTFYVVSSGRALVSDLEDMTSRMDHNLVNMQKQFVQTTRWTLTLASAWGFMAVGCHTPRVHTNKFLLRCTHGTSYVRRIGKGTCFATSAMSICVMVVVMASTLWTQ